MVFLFESVMNLVLVIDNDQINLPGHLNNLVEFIFVAEPEELL